MNLLNINLALFKPNFQRAFCKNLTPSIRISVVPFPKNSIFPWTPPEFLPPRHSTRVLRLVFFPRSLGPFRTFSTSFLMGRICFHQGTIGEGVEDQPTAFFQPKAPFFPGGWAPPGSFPSRDRMSLGAPDPALRCPRPPQRVQCSGYGHAPGWPGRCARGP